MGSIKDSSCATYSQDNCESPVNAPLAIDARLFSEMSLEICVSNLQLTKPCKPTDSVIRLLSPTKALLARNVRSFDDRRLNSHKHHVINETQAPTFAEQDCQAVKPSEDIACNRCEMVSRHVPGQHREALSVVHIEHDGQQSTGMSHCQAPQMFRLVSIEWRYVTSPLKAKKLMASNPLIQMQA